MAADGGVPLGRPQRRRRPPTSQQRLWSTQRVQSEQQGFSPSHRNICYQRNQDFFVFFQGTVERLSRRNSHSVSLPLN